MPTASPSLWTDRPDDWDEEHDAPAPPPAPRAPAPAGGGRRGRATALVVAALVATGGGAYALGSTGDGGSAGTQTVTAAAITPTPKTDVGKVYARVSAGVVSVRVGNGSGTGFVVDTKGTIVTNDHVVEDSKTAKVRFGDDDALVDATVVGTDPSSDLAVLHVDPAAVGSALHPLTFAPSKNVTAGDTAIAVGYPLGLDRTVTAGIISGLGRQIEAPNGYTIDAVLQTDAPINPGNSGGPLLDSQGRVIGINSQIATSGTSNGNLGIGFAVPSDTITKVIPKLLAGQSIERGWLGISSGEPTSGTGALVASVTDQSPAADAGLRAGDVVKKVDGASIASPDALTAAVADKAPGQKVSLVLERSGQAQTVELTLGTRPASAPSASAQPGATP